MPSPPPIDTITAGTLVAERYLVERLIGRGGMGEVFLARDLRDDRVVALKTLRDDLRPSPSAQRSFLRECRLAAALRHPNICAVFEVETDARCPYIAMEYVDGETLHDQIARGRLSLPRLVDISIQLASALEEARRQRVVHRDLKSANIVVTADGAAKILDFGLARPEVPESGDAAASGAALLAGTPAYMSPEQALGARVDHRSDLFALGVLIYEMASGRLPFGGRSTLQVLWEVVNTDPRPLPRLTEAERGLAAIAARLLQKHATRRYQTAADVRADLVALRARVSPRRRQVSSLVLLRPLAGVAAGLGLTFGGLVPGTVWLSQAAEAAWLEADDRRTSVWAGDAAGERMMVVVPVAAHASALSIGNAGEVVYSAARGGESSAIWRATSRTSPTFIAAGSQPSVSPDGSAIVFRGPTGDLELVRPDGRGHRQLAAGPVEHPAISAEGTLIFEWQRGDERALWSHGLNRARRPRRLTTASAGSRPIVSPDGRRLAFESEAGVIVCSLPHCVDRTVLAIGSPRAWTPDSQRLAYIGPPAGANVWTVSVTTGERRQVTYFEARTINSIAWSPDGRRLAVTRTKPLADFRFLPASR